jgi:hypothetical protein
VKDRFSLRTLLCGQPTIRPGLRPNVLIFHIEKSTRHPWVLSLGLGTIQVTPLEHHPFFPIYFAFHAKIACEFRRKAIYESGFFFLVAVVVLLSVTADALNNICVEYLVSTQEIPKFLSVYASVFVLS